MCVLVFFSNCYDCVFSRILRELTEVMSEDDNYNVYRHELAHALKGEQCVAFLGVFLTDVCQTLSYQQVKHQRQLSDGGEKTSKNIEKVGFWI